jgi:polyhydroxyalkanoate synthesis repressor PhaR
VGSGQFQLGHLLLALCARENYFWTMSYPAGAGKKLQIKKYPNRRYYDATHSRHLTLDEMLSLIQQGYDIEVIDAKTGKDITPQVLAQIILELETPKLDSFPVPLLLRLIRLNDQLVKDFIEKYFNQALKSFVDYQQQMEEQLRKAHGLPASFLSPSAWAKAMLSPLASAFGGGESEKPMEPANIAPEKDEDLRKLVRKLEAQVASLKKERTPGKSAGRRIRKGSR